MDRVAAFVNDPAQDELINMGAGPGKPVFRRLTDEAIEARAAACTVFSGIFTVIEPVDLDLYRSFLPEPLRIKMLAVSVLSQRRIPVVHPRKEAVELPPSPGKIPLVRLLPDNEPIALSIERRSVFELARQCEDILCR